MSGVREAIDRAEFYGVNLEKDEAALVGELSYELSIAPDRVLWCVMESLAEEARGRLNAMSADEVKWMIDDVMVSRGEADE